LKRTRRKDSKMADKSVKMGDSYKKDSHMQQTATGRAIATEVLSKRVLKYIDENLADFETTAPFRIGEFGAADGSNSVGVLTQIVETIRSRSATKPIEITCNDLPSANMTALFEHLNPLKEKFGNLYIRANGDSFYNQLFPDNSLDMSFSFTSVHWIQKVPCFLNATVYTSFGSEDLDPEAVAAWKKQAADDWRFFLECRQRELKPNGFFYASTINYKDPASKSNQIQAQMNKDLMGILVGVLEEYGIAEHKKEFNTPMAIRQRTQFLEPFHGDNPIGLIEEYYEDFSFEMSMVQKMIDEGNIEGFRMMMKAGSKAVTGPYHKAKLAKIESLTDEQREEVFEKIYEKMFENLEKYLKDKGEERGIDYCEMIFCKP